MGLVSGELVMMNGMLIRGKVGGGIEEHIY
jgi:hypothetical protein